jgi:hypothetical protein
MNDLKAVHAWPDSGNAKRRGCCRPPWPGARMYYPVLLFADLSSSAFLPAMPLHH